MIFFNQLYLILTQSVGDPQVSKQSENYTFMGEVPLQRQKHAQKTLLWLTAAPRETRKLTER